MFSGSVGQHLLKESWGFVKVGFPLGSLSTAGGRAEKSFRKSKNNPKTGRGTKARTPGLGVSSVPPACSCLCLARIDPSLGTPVSPR